MYLLEEQREPWRGGSCGGHVSMDYAVAGTYLGANVPLMKSPYLLYDSQKEVFQLSLYYISVYNLQKSFTELLDIKNNNKVEGDI